MTTPVNSVLIALTASQLEPEPIGRRECVTFTHEK
jgi:hypothetical protein